MSNRQAGDENKNKWKRVACLSLLRWEPKCKAERLLRCKLRRQRRKGLKYRSFQLGSSSPVLLKAYVFESGHVVRQAALGAVNQTRCRTSKSFLRSTACRCTCEHNKRYITLRFGSARIKIWRNFKWPYLASWTMELCCCRCVVRDGKCMTSRSRNARYLAKEKRRMDNRMLPHCPR